MISRKAKGIGIIAHPIHNGQVASPTRFQPFLSELSLDSLSSLLATGLEHQRSGRYHEAEIIYRQLLATHPDCAQAWNYLGMIALEAKCYEPAVGNIEKAIALKPNCAAFHNSLGIVRSSLGQSEKAIDSFRIAVRLEPDYADAHNNLGATLNTLGQANEAILCFENATRVQPRSAPFLLNLGRTLQFLQKYDQALNCFRQLLANHPDHIEARFYYSQVLGEIGQTSEQISELQSILGQAPQHVEAHNELGLAFARSHKLQEALKSFLAAVQLRAGYSDGYNNLGKVCVRIGRMVDAEIAFLRAIRGNPTNADAHLQLGTLQQSRGEYAEAELSFQFAIKSDPHQSECRVALARLSSAVGRPKEALESYRVAHAIAPDDPSIGAELGNQLQELGMFAEAEKIYYQVVQSSPNSPVANTSYAQLKADQGHLKEAMRHVEIARRQIDTPRLRILQGTLLPPIYESIEHIRSIRNKIANKLSELYASGDRIDVNENLMPTLFYLAYQGLNDREFAEGLAKLAINNQAVLVETTNIARTGKIKVAFISRNFNNHTIGGLNVGLVEKLSRELFEVSVFSIGKYNDEIGQRFQAAADRYIVIPSNLRGAAKTISQASPDILFYTDMGMDPFCYTLALSRLAPVQCVTWGHPVTTGLPTMDYFISSIHLESPESDNQYTERLVRLNRLAVVYEKPKLRHALRDRVSFGLPSCGTLYSCPQTLFKFHPEYDALIGDILGGDPTGILVLIEGKYPDWKEQLLSRFRESIPHVISRIHFLPRLTRPDFLNLLAISDVMLDPIHFGGGNTSYEGLAFGIPIVTLPSNMLRGRITHALYEQMHYSELVARDSADYVRIALELGTNPQKRKEASAAILAKHHLLFDDLEGVRELEKFFQHAVRTK